MTTVGSTEKIGMHKKRKEENILDHKSSTSEPKIRASCTHLHLLLPINQPLSKAQSLILHWQLSCDVHCTAQRRCKPALTLSFFLDFTQLVREMYFPSLEEMPNKKYPFRCISWKHHHGEKKKKNLFLCETFQSEKCFPSARFWYAPTPFLLLLISPPCCTHRLFKSKQNEVYKY